MLVKLIKDWGGKKAGEEKDVEADVAALLLGADYIEEPNDKALQNEALKSYINTKMDPLMQKLEKLLKKAGVAAPPTDGGGGDDKDKFKHMGEFLYACYSAANGRGADVRLRGNHNAGLRLDENGHIKALTAGHAGESEEEPGGFLVPEEYRAEILQTSLQTALIRPRARKIRMARDRISIPVVKDRDRSSNLFGGVIAYWLGEGATITASRGAFSQVEMVVKKLAGLTFASSELLADSAIAMADFIKGAFGDAIAYQEDESFFRGTGGGRPQGLLYAPCKYQVARAGAGAIALQDITGMYSRMYPPSLSNAVWIAHISTFPQFCEMTQNSGTSAPLVWLANGPIRDMGALAAAPPGTILGRPLYFTSHCSQLGTEMDLMFVDLRHYLIGDRQDLRVDASEHVAFETDEIAWRFIHRVDGQMWLAGTITDRQSWESSPLVVLSDAD